MSQGNMQGKEMSSTGFKNFMSFNSSDEKTKKHFRNGISKASNYRVLEKQLKGSKSLIKENVYKSVLKPLIRKIHKDN